jgi:uncharacterized protein YerC
MRKIILDTQQLEKIKELYYLGEGENKIAKHLRVGKCVILRHLEELNLPTGKNRIFPKNKGSGIKINFTQDQLNKIARLYQEGNNIYLISKEMNISPYTINRTLQRLNIPFRERKIVFTAEQLTQIVMMYDRGDGLHTIGQEFGVVKTVIDRVLRELGLPTGGDRIFPQNKFIPGVKINISDEQLEQIMEMYEDGISCNKIAKKIEMTRGLVNRILKDLNCLTGKDRILPKKKQVLPTDRQCRQCLQTLSIEHFRKRIRHNMIEFEYNCLECSREISCQYSKTDSKKRERNLRYNAKESTQQKKFEYYLSNKEKWAEERRTKDRQRRKEDPFYRLRHRISCVIWQYLNCNGGSKYGHSILEYLPYTIIELKIYLESLFEPWMTWNNYGTYRKEGWDDNDSSTWKWNIDHIIPHSDLPYTSMEDENFQKCWELSNLRPYSAKQNLLDGMTRVRHFSKRRFS